MKQLIFIFFLSIVFVKAYSQAEPPKRVDSKITRVTVFRNGAQVTRTASALLTQGKSQVVFSNISPNINTQSIQVRGEGNFTVLSVVHQLNYLNEQEKTREITELEARQRANREQLEDQQARLHVYNQEEQLIMKNQAIAGEQGVKIVELRETADFYRTRLSEIKLKQLDLNRAIKKINEDNIKLGRQLIELSAQRDMSTSEIVVALSAQTTTSARFTISYLVNNAGWHPTYDLRVKDINNPISLMYKANVFQLSGEDWNEVKLTMSTGNPVQNGTKPNLAAWYLQFGNYHVQTGGNVITGGSINQVSGRVTDRNGDALPGVTLIVKGTTTGTVTDIYGNYKLTLPANANTLVVSFVGFESQEMPINSSIINPVLQESSTALQEVVVTGKGIDYESDSWGDNKSSNYRKKKEKAAIAPLPGIATQAVTQTNVEFNIEIPYTIPNDGKMYTVDMQEYAVPAYYEYSCVPKLDTDVFLMARITDWEEYHLLDGEANLFFEGTFLGKSMLSVANLTDTLSISLGRDNNIVVTRTKLKNYTRKQFIGSSKKENREWEINVRNKKQQPINIVIEDQFPLTTDKEIEVTRTEWSGAEIEGSTGKLTWKFTLPPAESRKFMIKYEVKYPKRHVLLLD